MKRWKLSSAGTRNSVQSGGQIRGRDYSKHQRCKLELHCCGDFESLCIDDGHSSVVHQRLFSVTEIFRRCSSGQKTFASGGSDEKTVNGVLENMAIAHTELWEGSRVAEGTAVLHVQSDLYTLFTFRKVRVRKRHRRHKAPRNAAMGGLDLPSTGRCFLLKSLVHHHPELAKIGIRFGS